MENILTLNQSIFGTKTKKRGMSRRALKASTKELYIPQESEEITYDEGYDIDGGGTITFNFTISCTIGGFVQGLCAGLITSIVSGLTGGLGAVIGGLIAPRINKLLVDLFGNSLSSVINDALGGGGYSHTFTIKLKKFFLPTFTINKEYDLGEILGGSCGGGFGPGAATISSASYAY
jgi:hypothetical protein